MTDAAKDAAARSLPEGGMKLRALDLFCGAGGVSVGLERAGFDVVGVDIKPQPRHRGGRFVQADALEYSLDGFDFIWASPPCQAFTAYKRRPDHVKACDDLIPVMRDRLVASGTPYCIENVAGSSLNATAMLCGSMFGLHVRRHRYFECSFGFLTPDCRHDALPRQYPSATNRRHLRRTVEVGVWRIPLDVQQRAMGIDWMTRKELSQAIPPAYSEYIGRHAIEAIRRAV